MNTQIIDLLVAESRWYDTCRCGVMRLHHDASHPFVFVKGSGASRMVGRLRDCLQKCKRDIAKLEEVQNAQR